MKLVKAILAVSVVAVFFASSFFAPNFSQAQSIPPEGPGQSYYAAFPKTIALDGDFSDWAGIPQASVTEGPQRPANPGDGSMTFAVTADSDNLYFSANVTDSSIIAGKHGADYWNEDSVEIYLNTTGNLGLTSYTTGVAQITIPAADIGLPIDQAVISGNGGAGLGVKAMVVQTDGGYAMEAAIPLHTGAWNITPTNGATLGFEVQLNGATQADRDIKLSWSNKDKAQDLAYQNPEVFGQINFVQLNSNTPQPTLTLVPQQPTTVPPTELPIATLPPPPSTATIPPTDLPIATLPPPQGTPPPTIMPTEVSPTLPPTQQPTVIPPTPTTVENRPSGGGFSVQGSTIIAPNGQPFVAHGVNVNGYNWVWQRSTVGDVSLIADCWKFNLIRVNSFLFSGEQPWPQYGDNNNLDAIVNAYTSRGVVVLFEAHDRIGTYYQGNDLNQLVNWFTDLATRYRNNPYVWFDVANEPGGRNGIDANNWLNMHQQVIRAIRDTAGANNIIMVEGATGGQDSGSSGSGNVRSGDSAILQYGSQVINFGGKTYPNIVFSIHPYDLWNFGDAKLANFFDQVKAANLALIIGEYGVQTDQNTVSAASSVINTAPPRSIGRIVWHWDGHDYNDLTVNTSWGGGWEINNCSQPTNLSWLGLSVWIDNHSGH